MDQKQIEEIVRSVMASMGQTAPAPSEAKCTTTTSDQTGGRSVTVLLMTRR